jgi:hypothetical protein
MNRTGAIAFAVVLCLCFALWRIALRTPAGAIGVLVGSVLLAFLLARPLLNLAGEFRDMLRARIWRDLEGRHYAYRGHPVQVLEDASHGRWVRAADVREIVGFTASEGALALSYPNGFGPMGEPAQAHFSAEALLVHLGKESGAEAIRFRRWVEREIAFPARRTRERLGIRDEAPEFPPRSGV